MKIKSVSGIVCYVKDLNKSAKFYEALGFEIKKKDSDHIAVYSNWFWIDFIPADKENKPEFKKEAKLESKGAGLYLYLSVDDVDEFYKDLISKGLKPSSEPRDWPWGNKEFVIRDPDGYKLVIFKRK
ncbi:MAG: VOC family protein [Candidatus Levybacteria bacterium]|nr:VOC family protein [Candidatus Levybacteria bacterium]